METTYMPRYTTVPLRLSEATVAYLDALVRSGQADTRSAAAEAALQAWVGSALALGEGAYVDELQARCRALAAERDAAKEALMWFKDAHREVEPT